MKRIRFLSFIVFTFLTTSIFGQNEKFKALFIYNFTNYIDWPSGITGSFIITVVGESPIYSELEAISKIKKINGIPLEIKKVGSPSEAGKTQILYIPANKKKLLAEASASLAGKPTLIITDTANGDFCINFIEIDSKQSFQISKSTIEAHKLKVSSALITLGISVN